MDESIDHDAAVEVPEDRTMAMLSHLSFLALGVIGPALILLTRGKDSEFVRDQAVEALNFQLTILVAFIVASALFLIIVGVALLIVVYLAGLALSIPAAVAASRGERYRYPVALRIIH
jgi:uncharacterized protein